MDQRVDPIGRGGALERGGQLGDLLGPAAREIDSFISVPPRSFAPAARQAAAPSGPIFTHEAWTFRKLSSTMRDTASVRRYWKEVSSSTARAERGPTITADVSVCSSTTYSGSGRTSPCQIDQLIELSVSASSRR